MSVVELQRKNVLLGKYLLMLPECTISPKKAKKKEKEREK
jgi:hypothetical protein